MSNRETREYAAWQSMKYRCLSPSSADYKNYGGRGISICTDWLNSYSAFLKDMGCKPSKYHTLDRIDNNGNYCKENCRWATRKTQSRNQRSNEPVLYNGIYYNTRIEFLESLGLDKGRIQGRLKLGWSIEAAINKPLRLTKRIYTKKGAEDVAGRIGKL